jgi:hypothetical protein
MGDGQAMIRKITGFSLLASALLGLLPLACQPGGVGDPCTPEDEYDVNFPGYDPKEVNVESKSFQCETRVCLVNHFQGRVSCKYGQDAPPAPGATASLNYGNCIIPGSDPTNTSNWIQQQVTPQRTDRTADKAVYCSCRCDGDDKNARYCKCPSGYACTHLVDKLPLGGSQLAGSYCVRDNTTYDPTGGVPCNPTGYPKVPLAAGTVLSCGTPDDG